MLRDGIVTETKISEPLIPQNGMRGKIAEKQSDFSIYVKLISLGGFIWAAA